MHCEYKTKSLRAQQSLQLQKSFAARRFPEYCLQDVSPDGMSQGGLCDKASHVGSARERQTSLSMHCRMASLGRELSPSRG